MSVQRLVLHFLCAGFTLTAVLQAQELQWQSLGQISAGTKVQVVERSLKSTSGKFVGVSETDLTLRVDKQEVVIPRDRVYRVSINGKNRKRNVLIGLAIGAAAGVGVGVAANRVVGETWLVPTVAAVYAGAGAGVGAVCPSAKTVYRAELPERARQAEAAESVAVYDAK